MKTRTTNETGEKQMKTIRTQAAQQEARGSFKRANSMFGDESPFSTDSRREALMQLAAEFKRLPRELLAVDAPRSRKPAGSAKRPRG